MRRIYLDHAATSPLLPEVREAMLPWLDAGNPSSLHAEGRRAKDAIDEAREAVSNALGCDFGEVIFTSGGTEAANQAVVGSALAHTGPRKRVLLSAAEHHCVLHTEKTLRRLGFEVELVPVDQYGRLDLGALESALGDDVLLVAAMHANNELGTVQEISSVAERVRGCGALLFVDAVQSFRRIPFAPRELGCDLLAVSGHKIGGPKGVGALYIRGGVKPSPILVGGGQEREVRAGTENVAAIAGFGVAAQLPKGSSASVRDHFERCAGDRVVWTLPPSVPRLDGHSHFRVPGVRAESLLILLDRLGVSASAGAACSSGAVEASHVLRACGMTEEEAREGIRFSFGSQTTLGEAEDAANRLTQAIDRIQMKKNS